MHGRLSMRAYYNTYDSRVAVEFFLSADRRIAGSLRQGVCPKVEVGSCRSVQPAFPRALAFCGPFCDPKIYRRN
jgi:hypothetical protein